MYSFNGNNYRMERKWAKEQVAVAVVYTANVELTVVSPITADLKSSEANAIPPIKELEISLKVDNLTENQNLDPDLGPALFFLMHESRGIGS